jgi:hypothetical protein
MELVRIIENTTEPVTLTAKRRRGIVLEVRFSRLKIMGLPYILTRSADIEDDLAMIRPFKVTN